MVFIVAGPGQCNHHGAVKRQHHGTKTPAAASPLIGETLQLSRQVEGGEAKTGERNCGRYTEGEREREKVRFKNEVDMVAARP